MTVNGQARILQGLPLQILPEPCRCSFAVNQVNHQYLKLCTGSFVVSPQNIQTVRADTQEDTDLVTHLRHLTQPGRFDDETLGLEVTGSMRSCTSPIQPGNKKAVLLTLELRGQFIEFLTQLTENPIEFQLKIENLFRGSANNRTLKAWTNMNFCCEWLRDWYCTATLRFNMSQAEWRKFFSTKPTVKTVNNRTAKTGKPKSLSLIVKANLTAKMLRWEPIFAPNGKNFTLSFAMAAKANQRRSEVAAGLTSESFLVAASGVEFRIPENYLMEASNVFKVMLESPAFLEGRTRRIKLPATFSEEIVGDLIGFLQYFEMDNWINDYDKTLDMLEVADTYQILMLKRVVIMVLLKPSWADLNVEEALRLFAYSKYCESQDDVKMKRKAIRVLNGNGIMVNQNNLYRDLFTLYPMLAKELFTFVLQSYVLDE